MRRTTLSARPSASPPWATTFYKMKIHQADPRANRERVAAVRQALGGEVRLMVDANQRLDVPAAIRRAEVFGASTSSGSRSRVSPAIAAACAEVARAIRMPGGHRGEQSDAVRVSGADRAARGALPHVQHIPANGFSETLRIGHLAAAYQIAVSPMSSQEAAPCRGTWRMAPSWSSSTGRRRTCSRACRDARTAASGSRRPGHGVALATAQRKYGV